MPSSRLDATYSLLRRVSTRLRVTRAYAGHETTMIASTALRRLGPSAATTAIDRMIAGKAKKRSTTRMSTSSTLPPT